MTAIYRVMCLAGLSAVLASCSNISLKGSNVVTDPIEREWKALKAQPIPVDPAALARLDEVVERHIAQHVTPGAVIVVGRPGEILWEKAYGRMTYDPDSPPMTLETKFDLASVSKVAGTATMTMLLVQDGKLALDDPVSKYIPEFAGGGKQSVTIKDLLTHVSGLKAYEQVDKIKAGQKPGESNAQALIRHIASLEASAPPRTKMIYSCLNYLTLAAINQLVAGETQDAFLRRRVWEPLGMAGTTYYVPPDQVALCAPTIKKDEGDYQGRVHDPLAAFSHSEQYCAGNASLFSTGPDLARFCMMILSEGRYPGGRIFKPEIIHQMTIKQTPPEVSATRGLGFDLWDDVPYSLPVNKSDDTLTFGHMGYTGTMIWLDKNTKLFVVLLTNRVYPDDKAQVGPMRAEVIRTVEEAYTPYRDILAAHDRKPDTNSASQ